MRKSEAYKRAKEQAREIRDFYIHLISYVTVNSILFVINIIFSPDYFWFIWPLIGWGIGLFSHWVSVFGIKGFLDHTWEEKKIREIMNKNQ